MMIRLRYITINTQQICYFKWIDKNSIDITFSNGKTLSFEGKDLATLAIHLKAENC